MAGAALLTLACLLPSQAAARSDGKLVTLKLDDSGGLHLSFTSLTVRKGSFTAEQLGATQRTSFDIRGHGQSLSYTLDDERVLSGRRIDADLGPFGEIHGRFRIGKHLQGGVCNPLPDRAVRFSGSIRLQAENGIASAFARAAKGKLEVFRNDSDCGFKPTPKPAGDPQHLTSCGGDSVIYWADHDGGDVDVNHFAQATERVGDVRITRFVFATGAKSSFTANGKLTRARVMPGSPFSGSAVYADGELTGDLAATFLGRLDPIAITPAQASLTTRIFPRLPGGCPGVVFRGDRPPPLTR